MLDKHKLIAFHYFVIQAAGMLEEQGKTGSPVGLAAAYFLTENIVKGDYLNSETKYEQIEKAYNVGKTIYENLIKDSEEANVIDKLFDGSMNPNEIIQYAKTKGYMS